MIGGRILNGAHTSNFKCIKTHAKLIKNTNQHDCAAEERKRERRLKQERVRIAVTLNTFLAVT